MMQVVALLRQRIITLANGHQEEYALRNLFRSFDLDGSGNLSPLEFAGVAAKLGVTLTDVQLTAAFNFLDENKSGTLEFEEFQNFMMNDPYTKFQL